jgi:hypothetical protein
LGQKVCAKGDKASCTFDVYVKSYNVIKNNLLSIGLNETDIDNIITNPNKIRDDDTDTIIVDRWFQTVCRNVALELYEQQQADPENRAQATDMRVVRAKDIGDGRTEVS